MPISNYPNGFANGVTLQELPIDPRLTEASNVFWVDSNNGSNGNKGTFTQPFATIDYAIGRCTANNGDKIYVAAGHAESVIAAGGITADVAGIEIIGVGVGNNRPTITFSTATTATFLVSAADVLISGMRFVCNIASQATMLDCNAKRTKVIGCSFEEGTATGLNFIDINGGAANACDGVEVINCKFYAPTAGNYNHAIELGEVADEVLISGCHINGDFDDACIHNPTGKVLTNLFIEDCVLRNTQTGIHALELVSACTGMAIRLSMYTDTFATTIDPGSLGCVECYSISSTDRNARLNPVVES